MRLSADLSRTTDEAAARSGTYRLLARLWLREVDHDLLQALCAPPLRDSFVAAGGTLPAHDDAETVEQLTHDYCRLFVGPTGHLPPYQSVWQTGQFQGTATSSIKQFIEIVDYDRLSGTMLDHLGIELDVMGHILRHLSSFESDSDTLNGVAELANAFFTAHLTWPAELIELAANRATTEFYRSLCTLTRNFLDSEAQV